MARSIFCCWLMVFTSIWMECKIAGFSQNPKVLQRTGTLLSVTVTEPTQLCVHGSRTRAEQRAAFPFPLKWYTPKWNCSMVHSILWGLGGKRFISGYMGTYFKTTTTAFLRSKIKTVGLEQRDIPYLLTVETATPSLCLDHSLVVTCWWQMALAQRRPSLASVLMVQKVGHSVSEFCVASEIREDAN